MNLRSAILGLLSWKPSSGYDLKRIISDSDIFYWSGNNNQIYKSLLELQEEGLVTSQVEMQESLPAKKVYSVTEAGFSNLYQNLLAAPDVPEIHKGFLIQLACAEMLSDEAILALLEKYAGEIEARLRMYRGQAARPGISPYRSKREKYLWKRIAENLVDTYQAELDWARQTRQEILEEKFLKE